MKFVRMPIEKESPEEYGYERIACNLSESSVSDAVLAQLNLQLQDLTLFYGEHRGERRLRELIARQYGLPDPDHILITAGAASALFIVHMCLLEPGAKLLVEFPNYGTNLETPRALKCQIETLELTFEEQFIAPLSRYREKLTPDTRLISVTNPHNPTGTVKSQEWLAGIIELSRSVDCPVLVDETYRDLSSGEHHPLAATLDPRVISVASVSKAYGLPGIRIGWIVCQDPLLMEQFLAAKEQIFICNSVVDEAIAYQFLQQKPTLFPQIQRHVAHNLEILRDWMRQQSWLEWVEPQGGVVCFPRFKAEHALNLPLFYQRLQAEYHTFVGPGHWFEMDDRYMRLGYGWPTADALVQGLAFIEQAAADALIV